MTLGVTSRASVLLSGLVRLAFSAVGQAQAAPILGCPTVQPSPAPRTHEHSGYVVAPMARTRAFSFLSIHKRKLNKVGQLGEAPNLGACSCPTSILNSGTGRTGHQKRLPIECVVPVLHLRHTCIAPVLRHGIKTRLLPVKSTCKKYPSSIGATASSGTHHHTEPGHCAGFSRLWGKAMTNEQQALAEMPIWLVIVLALVGGVSGEMWRADKEGARGWALVRRLALRSGACVVCGVSAIMLLYAAGMSIWTSGALGCLTAMAGADVAIGLYERWTAKRLGLSESAAVNGDVGR